MAPNHGNVKKLKKTLTWSHQGPEERAGQGPGVASNYGNVKKLNSCGEGWEAEQTGCWTDDLLPPVSDPVHNILGRLCHKTLVWPGVVSPS